MTLDRHPAADAIRPVCDFASGGIRMQNSAALALVALVSVFCGLQPARATAPCIWGLGDSLMAGLVPAIRTELPGVTIYDDGFSGQFPHAIAARGGAIPVVAAIEPGILATAGKVPLKSITPDLLTNSSPARATARMSGMLGNRPGTLLWARGTGYSFELADGAGTDIRIGSSPRFVPDLDDRRSCMLLIWLGRNGVKTSLDRTMQAVRALVEPRHRNREPFAILTVHNDRTEAAGSADYASFARFNAALKESYGTNVIDVRQWLIDQSNQLRAASNSAEDQAERERDVVSRKLLADDVHLKENTNKSLAKIVIDTIRKSYPLK